MADYDTNVDQLALNQAGQALRVNELADAASPSLIFGRRASTCVGLTWGYYGGVVPLDNVPTAVANGTVTLTASDTNYIYMDTDGAVVCTTTIPGGWPGPLTTAGQVALYEVVTDTNGATDWTDYRLGAGQPGTAWTLEVHNAITGSDSPTQTTYTLQVSDKGKVITFNETVAITVTVASGLGSDFCCELIQMGAGQVTVAAGGGVTLHSYASLVKLAGQYAAARLVATSANVYNLSGTLSG